MGSRRVKWFRNPVAADDDNVTVISSSWCRTKSGIILSFAVPMDVLDVDEIVDYGKEFERAVKASYKDLLNEWFAAKTGAPVVAATPGGELIMLWSFQGEDDKETERAVKEAEIEEIDQ